jgi:hypothetical protein
MKNKGIIAFVLVAMLTAAFSVSAKRYSDQHQAVVRLFQSDKEKTAKDAVWTNRAIFKVGVFDNGSRRDGYAEYVCFALYDHGFKGKRVWVQIIDWAQLMRDGKWVKLGEARCQ